MSHWGMYHRQVLSIQPAQLSVEFLLGELQGYTNQWWCSCTIVYAESSVLICIHCSAYPFFLSKTLAASGLLSFYSFIISGKSYSGSHIMNCFHFGYFHLITSLCFQSCLPLEHLITHCLCIPWSLSSHWVSGHLQGIFSKVLFRM